MSVTLYDEAITNKIGKLFRDTKVKVLSPENTDQLLQIKSDENNDEPIALPMISISRNPTIEVLETQKKMMTYDGMLLDATEKTSVHLDAIPISISYAIEIWTREALEGANYLRELMFYLINHPKITVQIPYQNLNYSHSSYIDVDHSVEDNSDIPSRLAPGQFTRWTIRINIGNAFLFSVPYTDNIHIGECDVYENE